MKKLLLLITLFTLYTNHLHSQWVQQTVPVSKPITGIKFIDSLKGWACTENTGSPNTGYILFTSNGGTNWIIQDSVLNGTYGAISIINSNTVYCGGYDFSSNSANFKKTTNSGLNWILIPTPTNMAIADMVFLNEDSGWSCSSNIGADVRTTTNGGLNWIVRTSGITQQTQRIFFLNYNTGFCGANSNLYKTTNAGVNWVLDENFSETVNSIFFLNINTGWIGANNQKIYFTSNAGNNWVQQPNPGFGGTTTDIYFINSQTGWAGNRTIYIYKTTNGGQLWGYQRDTSLSYRISIIDSLRGWSGDNGISRTTNGGGPIIFTGINIESTEIPRNFRLHQNYPNPFNPVTNFKFEIPEYTFVKVIIYDILGRTVKTEVDNYLKAGTYRINFDADNLPSGTYFYRLTTHNFTETKKMILIK